MFVGKANAFWEEFKAKLGDKFLIEEHSNSESALNSLLSNQYNTLCPSSVFSEYENEDEDENCFLIDFEKIEQVLKEPNKANIVSVVIVDDDSPSFDTISFCEQLNQLPIVRILLVETFDLMRGVQAFNNGIVDCILPKDLSTADTLCSLIKRSQLHFFEKLSQPLFYCLESKKDAVIANKLYEKILNQIIQELQIEEYHISSQLGGYILCNKNNKYRFNILLDRQLNEYIEIAEESSASSEVLEMLYQKTHAPIFTSKEDYKLTVKEWPKILYPLTKEDNFYYVLIEE